MLGQAAAMLVSLSTLVATELNAVALPALFGKRLTVARPSDSCFLKATLLSSADMSLESSSIALSCPSGFGCIVNRWVGRLAGGEGRLPTIAVRAAAAGLDIVPRRALTAMGSAVTLSPTSCRAATTAAAFAAGFVMLFRRVTRWVGLWTPDKADREWELLREWDGGRADDMTDVGPEDID